MWYDDVNTVMKHGNLSRYFPCLNIVSNSVEHNTYAYNVDFCVILINPFKGIPW